MTDDHDLIVALNCGNGESLTERAQDGTSSMAALDWPEIETG